MSVAVVTDSTATLDEDTCAAAGLVVVPLSVVVGDLTAAEGAAPHVAADAVAVAMRHGVPVGTSRPPPEELARVYAHARDAGHDAVVSVHLSGKVSGTVESARLAAAEAGLPVIVVDTGLVGIGTGLAALAAARAAKGGASAEQVADAAREQARRTTTYVYVDTLEHLRRGGRVGSAAALMGAALAVKPILSIVDGRIETYDKVRTASRALGRMQDLVVAAASALAPCQVRVDVQHLAARDRADSLVAGLRPRLAAAVRVATGEVGAVIGAHVGPGMVAVVVAPEVHPASGTEAGGA